MNNFCYETDLYRLNVEQSDLFRCYGLRTGLTQAVEISSQFEEAFENYSLKFFTSVRSENIPAVITLGKVTIQKI